MFQGFGIKKVHHVHLFARGDAINVDDGEGDLGIEVKFGGNNLAVFVIGGTSECS